MPSPTVSIQLRVPPKLAAQIKRAAKWHQLSVNEYVKNVLEQEVTGGNLP